MEGQFWLDFTTRFLSRLGWIGTWLTFIQHSFSSLPPCDQLWLSWPGLGNGGRFPEEKNGRVAVFLNSPDIAPLPGHLLGKIDFLILVWHFSNFKGNKNPWRLLSNADFNAAGVGWGRAGEEGGMEEAPSLLHGEQAALLASP